MSRPPDWNASPVQFPQPTQRAPYTDPCFQAALDDLLGTTRDPITHRVISQAPELQPTNQRSTPSPRSGRRQSQHPITPQVANHNLPSRNKPIHTYASRQKIPNHERRPEAHRNQNSSSLAASRPMTSKINFPRYTDGRMPSKPAKPYSGPFSPRNSLDHQRFAERNGQTEQISKTPSQKQPQHRQSLSLETIRGTNVPLSQTPRDSTREKDAIRVDESSGDDNRARKRRRVGDTRVSDGTWIPSIEMENEDRRVSRVTSPIKASPERYSTTTVHPSSTSAKTSRSPFVSSSDTFRNVDNGMRRARVKPGPNAFYHDGFADGDRSGSKQNPIIDIDKPTSLTKNMNLEVINVDDDENPIDSVVSGELRTSTSLLDNVSGSGSETLQDKSQNHSPDADNVSPYFERVRPKSGTEHEPNLHRDVEVVEADPDDLGRQDYRPHDRSRRESSDRSITSLHEAVELVDAKRTATDSRQQNEDLHRNAGKLRRLQTGSMLQSAEVKSVDQDTTTHEDDDGSIDELHGPATIGSPTGMKPHGLECRARTDKRQVEVRVNREIPESPERDVSKFKSDIPNTYFASSDKQVTSKRTGTKAQGSHFEQMGFLLRSFRSSHHEPLNDPSLILVYVPESKTFQVRIDGNVRPLNPALAFDKLNSCTWSEDQGNALARLTGSKIGGVMLWFNLEFRDTQSVKNFQGILRTQWTRFKLNWKSGVELRSHMEKVQADPLLSLPTSVDGMQSRPFEKRALVEAGHATTVLPRRNSTARRTLISEMQTSDTSPSNKKGIHRLSNADTHTIAESRYENADVDESADRRLAQRLSEDNVRRTTRATTKRTRSPSLGPNQVREEDKYSVKHGLGEPWDEPIVYPLKGIRRTTVQQDDLIRLDEGEFLNDSIIEFYIRWLWEKLNVSEQQVYVFSTHFYTTLTRNKFNYLAVERWTAKVDIFSRDFTVIPIHQDFHWYLAIVCNLPKLRKAESEEIQDSNDVEVQPISPTTDEPIELADTDQDKAKSYRQTKVDDLFRNVAKQQESSSETDFITIDDDGDARESMDEGPGLASRVRQEKPTAQLAPDSQSTQVSEIGIFADVKMGSHANRKTKRKSGPPPRKYGTDQPAIVLLDSLSGTHSATIRNIKDYLIEEGKSKRGLDITRDELQGIHAREGIPKQSNMSDCGLYVLGYVHKFLEDPKQFGRKLLAQEFDLQTDWPNMIPSTMRDNIRRELFNIYAEQKVERDERRRAKKAAKRADKMAVQSDA